MAREYQILATITYVNYIYSGSDQTPPKGFLKDPAEE